MPKKEESSNEPAISTFVPPNLETRLVTVPAVTNYRPQSSSKPGQRTDVQDRLGGSAHGENHQPWAKIRACQPNVGDDQHLQIGNEIGDDDY